MTPNINPDTGIAYGVISGNSLDPDIFNALFYDYGTNLSEEEAMKDLREQIMQEVHDERADGIAEGIVDDEDLEDEIAYRYEKTLEHLEIEEPTIEGEHDGVKYMINWLGGAPLVWALEGPVGSANRACSPCVPCAGDLDSGFSEDPKNGYECYIVPRSWLRLEP